MNNFKPFDKVIWRYKKSKTAWSVNMFSHYYSQTDCIVLIGLVFNSDDIEILPYEGNEYLVGTTDDPVEEVKIKSGEQIVVFEDLCNFKHEAYTIPVRTFASANVYIYVRECFAGYKYCARLKDVDLNNPSTIIENALEVKDDKLVKVKKHE